VSRKIIIMGAAGRDFHVFNCLYRVVAFTATQIPHIDDRRYPASLAGSQYPDGILIHPEEELNDLIGKYEVEEVVFAYSDVSLDYVDGHRKNVEAQGVTFSTFDVDATMLPSAKPMIAVCAVRTGCGKSQTSRRVTHILKDLGKKTVAIRHPMPYGDLAKQAVQRFATLEDLDLHKCTIEEREEYEPHLRNGVIVYAGVDYAAILAEAEKNFERADLILINKIDSSDEDSIKAVEANAARVNPNAVVVRASSPLDIPDPDAIKGKRVLAIEDGPTTTHGGMPFGAGILAARQSGVGELVDPRPWAVGEIADTFENYPDTGPLLPAMGYGEVQIRDLEATVNAVDCDLVLVATPIDLTRLITINKPNMRIGYRLAEEGDEFVDAVTRVST
jgi:predicted GTPase